MSPFDVSYWYALRVTYNREMQVKQYCDANNIQSFVPVTYKVGEANGRKIKKVVPVIRNLIFVKSSRRHINEMKLRLPIRYMMDRAEKSPIIIPEKDMQNFITVASNYDEEIVFLDSSEAQMKVGGRVRIKDGIFKGVEGVLVKVRNRKRVLVQIEGLLFVATHYIRPSMLENL